MTELMPPEAVARLGAEIARSLLRRQPGADRVSVLVERERTWREVAVATRRELEMDGSVE
jgi:hypothetical protein